MARFRGTVVGSGNEASRLGNKSSGLVVRANGWNVGIKVSCFVNQDGEDEIVVHKTGGSNNLSEMEELARITSAPDYENTEEPEDDA